MNILLCLLPVALAITLSLLLWVGLSPKLNLNYRAHAAFYIATVAMPVQILWGFTLAMHPHMTSGFTTVAAATTLAQCVTAATLLDIDVTKDRVYSLLYLVVATFAVYSLFTL